MSCLQLNSGFLAKRFKLSMKRNPPTKNDMYFSLLLATSLAWRGARRGLSGWWIQLILDKSWDLFAFSDRMPCARIRDTYPLCGNGPLQNSSSFASSNVRRRTNMFPDCLQSIGLFFLLLFSFFLAQQILFLWVPRNNKLSFFGRNNDLYHCRRRVLCLSTDLLSQFCNKCAIHECLIDHRSYTHNLSSCEIKAWKKFKAERDSNPWPLRTLLFQSVVGLVTVDNTENWNKEKKNTKQCWTGAIEKDVKAKNT